MNSFLSCATYIKYNFMVGEGDKIKLKRASKRASFVLEIAALWSVPAQM